MNPQQNFSLPRSAVVFGVATLLFSSSLPAQDILGLPEMDADIDDGGYEQRLDPVPATEYSDTIPEPDMRDDGPRIKVREIAIEGLPDVAESGVDPAEVLALIERLRAEAAAENRVRDSGFTTEELDEIGTLLQRHFADNQVDSAAMAQELIDTVARQRFERGLSYFQLESIAAEVTRHYRERGLFLARAVIPEQDVEDGVVTLRFVPGRIGELRVANNKVFDDKLLRQPFADTVGKIVTRDQVEEAFYLLNDRRGLSAYGFFSPGQQPGETALNIQVTEEHRWHFRVRADNHGSRFTGDERIYAVMDRYNVTGRGDSLSVGALHSFDPSNATLGRLEYRLPVSDDQRRTLSITTDYNDFSVEAPGNNAINDLQISGFNRSNTIGVSHYFNRSRALNKSAAVFFADKETKTEAAIDLGPGASARARTAAYKYHIDGIQEDKNRMGIASATLTYGDRVDDVGGNEDGYYWKLFADASLLQLFPSPFDEKAQDRVVISSQWLYSDHALPSFEQLSLGGTQAVKAFTAGDFTVDRGVYIGAEYFFPLPKALQFEAFNKPSKDWLQIAAFVDLAYGDVVNNVPGSNNDWAHLSGWGLLLRFDFDEAVTGQISFSDPLSSKSSLDGLGRDAKSIRTYFDLTYRFE